MKVWNQWQVHWAQQLADFNFKIIYRLGARGEKPDALSRQPEYRPEGGAKYSEQSILKPEHFGQSLIYADDKEEGCVSEPAQVIQQAIWIKWL